MHVQTVFASLLLSGKAFGREKWLERKNRVSLHSRHSGHEQIVCPESQCASPPSETSAFTPDSGLSNILSSSFKISDTCGTCESIPTVTISGTNPEAASATNAVTIVIGGGAAAPFSVPLQSITYTTSAGAATSIMIVSPVSESFSSTASTPTVSVPSPTSTSFGNFGSCPPPEILFEDDGLETSFEPANRPFYDHAPADFDTIAKFICSTLENSCGADATAQNACAEAKSSGDSQTVGTGNQADSFNARFGIRTSFSVQPVNSSGSSSDDNTSSQGDTDTAPLSTASSSSLPQSTIGPTSDNLQTFTGALGGVTAPVVRDIGNGEFKVDGDAQFNKKKDALNRSCAVQHNNCANSANASDNKSFRVNDCDGQLQSCNAAASN